MSDWGKIYCGTWWGSPEPQQYDRLVTNKAINWIPDCGTSPVEPAERWFLHLDLAGNNYVQVPAIPSIGLNVKTTVEYICNLDSDIGNSDMYSNSGNSIYTRWRGSSDGFRMRWGGTGPNVIFAGLTVSAWFHVKEVHNIVANSTKVTVTNLATDTVIYDATVGSFGVAGSITDFRIGNAFDLSNPFYGYIGNFKIYDATDTLIHCWRIDEGTGTTITNECSAYDGTVNGTAYSWAYLANPLAGDPL